MGFVINTQQTYRCPCTSGLVFDDCCRPILTGHKRAVTAEALIRARFSAYVVKDIEYLLETTHPAKRPTEIPPSESFRYWLEIEQVIDGGPHDATGSVTYTAYHRRDREHWSVTERAGLERIDGRWMYRGGETIIN